MTKPIRLPALTEPYELHLKRLKCKRIGQPWNASDIQSLKLLEEWIRKAKVAFINNDAFKSNDIDSLIDRKVLVRKQRVKKDCPEKVAPVQRNVWIPTSQRLPVEGIYVEGRWRYNKLPIGMLVAVVTVKVTPVTDPIQTDTMFHDTRGNVIAAPVFWRRPAA